MARTIRRLAKKTALTHKSAERVSRDRVITFRISTKEAALIQRAADRCPLARYSRDAVLAKAAVDVKK